MSFTTNIKNEISNDYDNLNAIRSELTAILRNSYKLSTGELELVSENSTVCKHIYNLFKEIYNINIKTEYKNTKFTKNRLYSLAIDNVSYYLKDLSVIDDNDKFISEPYDYLVECEDEKRSYLKGVFLVSGSINDPKTSMYHLEFFIDSESEAKFVSRLLNEFYLNSKVIERDKGYMVYLKEAEKIGDFLRIVGANQAVMYYEDIRIYRDHKNMTNRLNNMEQANIDKSIMSSSKQIEDINLILDTYDRDLIDPKILEVMEYRLKYSESSLQELSEIMSLETGKDITKSGLNHRFRKIKEIANNIKNNNL